MKQKKLLYRLFSKDLKKKDKSFRPSPTIDMVVENSGGKVSGGG